MAGRRMRRHAAYDRVADSRRCWQALNFQVNVMNFNLAGSPSRISTTPVGTQKRSSSANPPQAPVWRQSDNGSTKAGATGDQAGSVAGKAGNAVAATSRKPIDASAQLPSRFASIPTPIPAAGAPLEEQGPGQKRVARSANPWDMPPLVTHGDEPASRSEAKGKVKSRAAATDGVGAPVEVKSRRARLSHTLHRVAAHLPHLRHRAETRAPRAAAEPLDAEQAKKIFDAQQERMGGRSMPRAVYGSAEITGGGSDAGSGISMSPSMAENLRKAWEL
jgi:hypothetical protein